MFSLMIPNIQFALAVMLSMCKVKDSPPKVFSPSDNLKDDTVKCKLNLIAFLAVVNSTT